MNSDEYNPPPWAFELLASPDDEHQPLQARNGTLWAQDGRQVGRNVGGIVRFDLPKNDQSIDFYKAVGGAHFHERSSVKYAMTTLDTTVYHGYLEELRPADLNLPIIDVGGGDGRNAMPWLEWGYRRVVVVDAVFDALARIRERISSRHPEWLHRVLLIEADARHLPLMSSCGTRVVAVEALAYLNQDYDIGLAECVRVMAPNGRILVADRDYEGGILMHLLYFGGIAGMLEHADTRDLWDGGPTSVVQSRCFTSEEFEAAVRRQGLHIVEHKGISALSLVLSYLRSEGKLARDDDSHLSAVHALLQALGRSGRFRRSHVIVAEHARSVDLPE